MREVDGRHAAGAELVLDAVPVSERNLEVVWSVHPERKDAASVISTSGWRG